MSRDFVEKRRTTKRKALMAKLKQAKLGKKIRMLKRKRDA